MGLLPIVPTIPHADRAFGIFAEAEQYLTDLLNHIEHLLKHPVEVILFFFGLLNAGVAFSSIGSPTWLVLAGLSGSRRPWRFPFRCPSIKGESW